MAVLNPKVSALEGASYTNSAAGSENSLEIRCIQSSAEGGAAEAGIREQELFGDASHSGQGSLYYALTDALSASCYGDISESVNSSDQTPPYAATEEGSQASVDNSVVVGKGSATSEASSDGVQHNEQPADNAPTDRSSATSEGLSPITAAESGNSGAVSDGRLSANNNQEVSINRFDIPAVGGEPVMCYSESAGPVLILGAVDTPQPGSDPEAQAIAKQKKESLHWNLADLAVQCTYSLCQVNMGTVSMMLIEPPLKATDSMSCSVLAPNELKGLHRTAFVDEGMRQFRKQMATKAASKNWGYSEESVKRFTAAMQEA